jgi:hypothetical protein
MDVALLIARRALLAVLVGGCFGGTIDPTGHPCTSDADCALVEGLVCDPGAGVCVDAGASGGSDGATTGGTTTTGSTSTSDGSSGSVTAEEVSSATASTSTTAGETGSTGEVAMISLDAVVPDKGRGDVDRDVVVHGAGFDDYVTVWFGDDEAEMLTVAPDQLQVRVPANANVVGAVDVRVERDGDEATIPGAYRRVRGYPTFDALETIALFNGGGVIPATFEMTPGDFDGDGAIDLVLVWENGSDGAMLAVGDGAGGFGIGFEHPEPAISVDRGDFDGDGSLDFATIGSPGLRVYENDGFGGFSFTTFPGVIGFARGIATIDADHVDGPEVVVRGAFATGVQVWRNDGSGGLFAPVVYSVDAITSGDFPVRSTVGDFTGDGWDDIVTPVEPPNAVSGFATYVNDGTGGFDDPVFTALGWNGTASIATQLDAGVDDLLDVVALTYNTQAFALSSLGDGGFDAAELTPGVVTVLRVAAADFNCDDASDIVLIDGATSFAVHRGSPGGSLTQATSAMFATDGVNRAVEAVDLDGDGLADLIIAHHALDGTLELRVFRNSSAD